MWENLPSELCVQQKLRSDYAWKNFVALGIQNAPSEDGGWLESLVGAHVRKVCFLMWLI